MDKVKIGLDWLEEMNSISVFDVNGVHVSNIKKYAKDSVQYTEVLRHGQYYFEDKEGIVETLKTGRFRLTARDLNDFSSLN